jgi:hypothetical protein
MLPLLAIAQGAFKVGGKIINGIKNAKVRKKAKADAKAAQAALNLQNLQSTIGNLGINPGATPITQSGNTLMVSKENAVPVEDIAPKGEGSGSTSGYTGSLMDFLKTPIGIVVALVGGYIIAKAFRIIR